MRFTLYLALIPVSLSTVLSEEEKASKQPAFLSKAEFAVAYVFRSTDERDARPILDPASKRREWIPAGGLLHEKSIIDVAAMGSLVTERAMLKNEQFPAISKALIDGEPRIPVSECYDPHHAIVFYTADGQPVSCVEICFTCNRVKSVPSFYPLTVEDNYYERTDLIAIARMFSELGLSLTPYASFDALKKNKEQRIEEAKEDLLAFRKLQADYEQKTEPETKKGD